MEASHDHGNVARTDSAYYYSTRPGPPRLRRRIGFWIVGPPAAAILAIYAWFWRVPVAYLRRSGSVPPPPWVRAA